MAQSPMISVPLKATSEIDWVAPLKRYIRESYSDDPERYADECATLHRLRQDMRGAGKESISGRDMLYRYYGQLELLDLRFPVDEKNIKISFTWYFPSPTCLQLLHSCTLLHTPAHCSPAPFALFHQPRLSPSHLPFSPVIQLTLFIYQV